MKKLLTSALLLVGAVAFAQSTASKPGTTSKPASTTATSSSTAQTQTGLSDKAKSLCKEWLLAKTENFGDQHDPTAEQKSDKLVLMSDGRYRLVMNGVAEGGSWTIDKSNTMISLKSDAGIEKKFKVLESTATTLKVDYRDSDDIHNILYYSVTGKSNTTSGTGTQQK